MAVLRAVRAVRVEDEDAEGKGPSRELIEKLVLLEAIGTRGCSLEELTVLLGLSMGLVSAVAESTTPLVSDGFVFREGVRVTVTPAGEAWFEQQLAHLSPGGR